MRLASILVLFVTFICCQTVSAQNTLRLSGPGTWADQTQPLVLEVRVDNDADVDRVRLAIDHDETQITLDDFTVDIASGTPFIEFFPVEGGVIAQIIFDTPLLPAANTLLATLTYNAVSPTAVQDVVAVQFVDGVHGDPAIDNELELVGGSVVSATTGLTFEQYVAGILSFTLGTTDISVGATGISTVFLSTDTPVQGYQFAVAHDPAELVLEDVNLLGTVTEALGADFIIPEVLANGATMAVILDLEAPFEGQIIPVGSQQAIGQLEYSCVEHPLGTPPVEYAIDFIDGVLGAFPVTNIIVSEAGDTVQPEKFGNVVRCLTAPLPTDVQYFAGQLSGDAVVAAEGIPGGAVDVGLFYTEPQFAIDAFDISLSIPCELGFVGLSIVGSTLESVGVEFISTEVDEDAGDGDGCEFTALIVIDSLPPFDGQQAPATATPLLLGTLSGTIPISSPSGTSFPIEFIDGLDGESGTPVDNQVQILGLNYPAVGTASSVEVTLPSGTQFSRGDCNNDGGLDISDAISFLDFLFGGVGTLSCDAACDSNNDGGQDIADAIYALTFLFVLGPEPAAPFPGCGLSAGEPCASFSSCP